MTLTPQTKEENASSTLAADRRSDFHPPDLPSEELEVSTIDVFTHLANGKWLIAKVIGATMLVGLILCFALPVKYTATTRIMTPQQSSSAAALMSQLSSPGAGSLAALAGGGLGVLKDPNSIYIGVLGSRPVADAIIQRFNLSTVYRAKNMTDARKALAKNTSVASEKSGFIALSVTDKDKKRVAEIANAYTEELTKLMKFLAVTEASQRRLFYEEQLKQSKESLIAAELALQQVQQKKGLVYPDAQAKAMIESLEALRAKAAAKEVEVQALRTYSTEHNSNLQLAERELSSLHEEISQLEQKTHTAGFGDLGLAEVPGASLEYLRADHEVRYQQALFDLLLKQYDAAKLDEAKEGVIVQVVEPAIMPDKKSSPKRAIIMVISVVAGCVIGCAYILFVWWNDEMQNDPEQLAQFQKLKAALWSNS